MNIRSTASAKGFTLFEVILALAIFGTLFATVIMAMSTNLNLSVDLLEEQERQLQADAVEDHIERHLLSMGQDPQLTVSWDGTNSQWQTLTMKNPQHYFPFEGKEALARQTDFVTVINNNDRLDLIQLHYATQEDASTEEQETYDKITYLLRDQIDIRWHLGKKGSEEFQDEWLRGDGLPTHIKLIYRKNEDDPENVKLIWLPPRRR